ncbi:biopolymer transporter ExbD (plasmid) [Thioclava litoralis]|uniref:Biopolymer transporter ExbD n=1 Tax=Thioclava litoralis TaxID=3076557 RepID=A0ABZ1E316_9RHOB|nr:biopolymer transporter ExbD [Thioclava sp. FTW29]
MARKSPLLPPAPAREKPDMALAIVNVVLLLIMFFLATGALFNRAAPSSVSLSQTTDLAVTQLPKPLLEKRPDGGLYLDDAPVTPDALGNALAPVGDVYVLIDKTAPAFELTSLLALPGLSGHDIVLVTVHSQPEAGPQP